MSRGCVGTEQQHECLAHGCQDDIDNCLFAAANCHLHSDAVSQRQASSNQHVMTSPKHT